MSYRGECKLWIERIRGGTNWIWTVESFCRDVTPLEVGHCGKLIMESSIAVVLQCLFKDRCGESELCRYIGRNIGVDLAKQCWNNITSPSSLRDELNIRGERIFEVHYLYNHSTFKKSRSSNQIR